MTTPPGSPARRQRAVRLLFTYEQGAPRLLSQRVIDAVAPPTLPVDHTDDAGTGFWVEVRSGDGHREYLQLLADPTGSHVEVFSAAGRTVVRAPAPGHRVVFGVLVPVRPESAHVALLSGPGVVGTIVPAGGAAAAAGDDAPAVMVEPARIPLELGGVS